MEIMICITVAHTLCLHLDACIGKYVEIKVRVFFLNISKHSTQH